MKNYIRLIYCKQDVILYIKLKQFLEWVGFRIYEYRLEIESSVEKNQIKWEEPTIFFYCSELKDWLKTKQREGEQFFILSEQPEELFEHFGSVIYYSTEEEIPYNQILKEITFAQGDIGIEYLVANYSRDLIRSIYTISQIYVNSKLNYKKSELLEEAEVVISAVIRGLEDFAREKKLKLEENIRFFYAINYLKDLQNVKRKLFQEELAWSSQEIVDSLNELLKKESDFKSCYLLKASVCEKQLVLDISELPIVNLLNGVDRLDYIAQYKLGVFYQNNRLEEEKAFEQYKKCLTINPCYYRNLYKLALYYKSRKEYDLALEYFSKILNVIEESDIRDWETEEFEYYFKVQFFAAQIYWNTEEYYKASLAYQKAFSIWSCLKECKVVKELYKGKEDQIKLFMQNKYQLEEKRQSIINEIGIPLKILE